MTHAKTDAGSQTCRTVPRVVEVKFLIPGARTTVETYRLGRADDLLTWRLNEVLTPCVQLSVTVVDAVEVNEGLFRHMMRSRAGMRPWIDRQVSNYRNKARNPS